MHKPLPRGCFLCPIFQKNFFQLSQPKQAVMSVKIEIPFELEPLVPQHCSMIMATRVVIDEPSYQDTRTWEVTALLERPPVRQWVQTDTAPPACPAHSSILATSRTFAVVTCDADEPIFVNNVCETETSFTIPPRRITRPLCSGNSCFNSEFSRWRKSTSVLVMAATY